MVAKKAKYIGAVAGKPYGEPPRAHDASAAQTRLQMRMELKLNDVQGKMRALSTRSGVFDEQEDDCRFGGSRYFCGGKR